MRASGTFHGRPVPDARSAFSRSHEPVRIGRTSMQPTLPSPRCLPPSKTSASTLSGARAARCTRWPAGAAAALFHRGSKTPTRPLFARCRGRLEGRARFYGFCKWMFPRARQRTARTSRPPESDGTTAGIRTKVAFRSGQPPKLRRARGREHRVSTLPTRDCSRWRLRPDPDRFEHLVSRTSPASLPGETREESDAADAARTCIARAARGSCDARFPRRNPTPTNPRGLLSSGRSRCEREAPLRDSRSCTEAAPAPFSPPDPARARDARTRADSSAPWAACERRTARYCPKAAAPPRTSAFE